MSARLEEHNISDDWKEKYHHLNKVLDEKSRKWKNEENELYKSILRLILSYSGISPQLDKELQEMRNSLRQGADDATRKQVISGIIEKILDFVQENKETPDHSGIMGEVVDLFKLLILPDPYNMDVKRMLNAINTTSEPKNLLPKLDRIIAVINKSFAEQDLFPGEPRGRDRVETPGVDAFGEFMKRLSLSGEPGIEISRLKKRLQGIQDENSRLELIDELIQFLQKTFQDNTDDQEVIDFKNLRDSLHQLIEWLPLSKQYETKITDIKNQLNKLGDEKELKKVLRKIATLVNDFQGSLQEELIEIQKFLNNITLRLKDIESHIYQVDRSEGKSRDSSNVLNQSVQSSVREIRDDIEQANDLKKIKQAINQKLMVIEQSMDLFIKSEQDRRVESEHHIEKLNKRIVDMKQVADKLHKKIQEERNKSQIDALTGIANRLAFDARMQEEYNRWQRYKQPLTICVVDIDKFKSVNDTYGHKAGDKVLTTVAELCDSRIRETDFFARYGGEEFVIILPETDLRKARIVAENLRKEVEDCTFHYAQVPVDITVSCGLSQFRNDDTIESVFVRADAALYEAKNSGRNRCKSK